jgi:peptide deformylase
MIVTDQEILRQKSEPIEYGDPVEDIVQQLKDALETAWTEGCGLAAIQIGIPKQIAWLNWGLEEFTLVNPVIIEATNFRVDQEGCLSIPDNWIWVKRPDRIVFENNGLEHEFTGFQARIIDHEVDHMRGVLNIDKAFQTSKIGRNDLCFCGSKKKYKNCCLHYGIN